MASLYIKDAETNTMAEQLAAERGLTKTAAVKLALRHELDKSPARSAIKRRDSRAMVAEFKRATGWSDFTGPDADKAFFDSLYEE